jgi:hypothetical protein
VQKEIDHRRVRVLHDHAHGSAAADQPFLFEDLVDLSEGVLRTELVVLHQGLGVGSGWPGRHVPLRILARRSSAISR